MTKQAAVENVFDAPYLDEAVKVNESLIEQYFQ